jgi:aryl-alcohol dehydrogenase-like predicted oxidoreductase
METVSWREYRLTRMMLGTVQFGQPYGVANRTGQPGEDAVRAIVRAALDGDLNGFDTAAAYGSSEAVLGRALAALGVTDRVVVVTKVQPLPPDVLADSELAAAAIEASVAESRRRLGMDELPIVLFHRESDAVYLPVLHRLRERGWLRYAGVSCDNRPGPAREFAVHPEVAAMQLPANLLDRRHRDSGAFAAAAAREVALFIRSAYLQGLLLMPEDAVPLALRAVLPVRRRLDRLAAQAGITPAALAVRYLLGLPGVTSVLTGVETPEQVRDNLAVFAQGPLPADLHAAVEAVDPDLPAAIITPAMWPALIAES